MTRSIQNRCQKPRAGRSKGRRVQHGQPAGAEKRDIGVVVSGSPTGLRERIRRAAVEAVHSQGYCHGRLEIAIVDAAEMRRQHKQWMGRATLTDVLSFDLRDRPEGGFVDGQLIICEAVARREAGRQDTDWRGELLLYVVHGCLHLCGHDDHQSADAARMNAQEDKLLSLLGWGPVFAGPSAGRSGRGPRASRSGRGQA
jgi:probable rRNA maturation factor